MRRLFLLSAIVSAAPATAQEATQADIDAMVKAVEDAGCVVTVANGDAVLAASGLDAETTTIVITTLYEQGLVALQDDGSMKLTNEACP